MAEDRTEDEITSDADAVPPADEAAAPVDETPADDETTRAATSSEATVRHQPREQLPPKERRRRARAAKAAAVRTRAQMSPEERQAERDTERSRKARIRSTRRKREREKARAGRASAPAAEPLAPRREKHPGQQKTRQGIVVSDRASKTIVVRIDVARRHPSYEKVVRTSTTLHAHDEKGEAHIGDTVIVREARPLSRTKRWRLVEVVERAR
jgi:small subunit ribosomal protein S17